MAELKGKKAVMIIASSQFRDEELFETRKVLEAAGVKVTLASSSLKEATGMLGGKAKADVLLKDVKASDYDAVIFVGGMGANEYFADVTAHALAREAVNTGKVVAAICIAPSTLANAGVLKGKKATCYPSEKGNLVKKGADHTGKNVEKDGKLITADGPTSAKAFGHALVEAMK